MTFIALDDEPLALVLIEKYAELLPDWQLLSTFTDADTAAEFLRNNTVDLLLTDINMPDINGLQFVEALPDERPMVIFVTAYKEFAHEGFNLDVVDYLVKPVSIERFKKAMSKASELLELRQKAEVQAPAMDHIFVLSEYQKIKIMLQDVLYLESMGDYVKIYLESQAKPILTLDRLKNLANSLHPVGFRRIHRSLVVNLAKVAAVQKSKVKVAGKWLNVGETYLQEIESLVKK
jgi:two-component system, LytTR family, response regulator